MIERSNENFVFVIQLGSCIEVYKALPNFLSEVTSSLLFMQKEEKKHSLAFIFLGLNLASVCSVHNYTMIQVSYNQQCSKVLLSLLSSLS